MEVLVFVLVVHRKGCLFLFHCLVLKDQEVEWKILLLKTLGEQNGRFRMPFTLDGLSPVIVFWPID